MAGNNEIATEFARPSKPFRTLSSICCLTLAGAVASSGAALSVADEARANSLSGTGSADPVPFWVEPEATPVIEAAGSGTSVATIVSHDVDMPQIEAEINARARAAKIDSLISAALSKQGIPYVYGGMSLRGFDCSGFVKYCFNEALGMNLPRIASSQSSLGANVSLSELQPGDLVFWGSRGGAHHVGISLGGDKYIHAPRSGKRISIGTFSYYKPSFAKRIAF